MISVIIPVYNLERDITFCLNSLIHQTYQDLDILLLDDGSTDQSLSILKQWQQTDPRIRVFHHENQGVSATRNLGLDHIRGEYVFFLDGDDWLEPDCLETLMAQMIAERDFVACDFVVEEEPGCEHEPFLHQTKTGLQTTSDLMHDYYHDYLYTLTIWGKLYQRRLWEDVRFQPLRYSEDTLAMLEVLQQSHQAYLCTYPGYHYRQRAAGASHAISQAYYQETLYTVKMSYQTAVGHYPEHASIAAEKYINLAYALLKCYEATKQKHQAFQLIKEMQEVYRTKVISSPSRAQRLLALPASIVYGLLHIKRRLQHG